MLRALSGTLMHFSSHRVIQLEMLMTLSLLKPQPSALPFLQTTCKKLRKFTQREVLDQRDMVMIGKKMRLEKIF
jgi:hypothetical protein